ncbi:hypothetical protein [Haladaptatus sp. YSMS36]|uniref:hypothetical protein n=1 Tax=Haladaptatus sp. YSMS36 TaxID=3033384 RepID=UPI0023E8EF40|nr:hypothetical protein [Haladaptatus sp. YSMS36]
MAAELSENKYSIVPLWVALIAAFSLSIVVSTVVLWAFITFSVVYSISPNTSTIEIGKLTASLLAIVINLFFSAGLVYIYIRQTRVLRDQRDINQEQSSIQKSQQRIMEAEYIPAVDISVGEVEGDEIQINCSNEGTGLAKNFEIDIEFFVSFNSMDRPAEFDQGVILESLSEKVFSSRQEVPNHGLVPQEAHLNGTATTPSRKSDNENLAQINTGEILREQEDDIFYFSLSFEKFVEPGGGPGNPNPITFHDGIQFLRMVGIETLGFQMNVAYYDIFGEKTSPKNLASGWINIRNGTTVKKLINNSKETGIFRIPEPFTESFGKYRTTYYPYL